MAMDDAAYLSRILRHYFRMSIEGNGRKWETDYAAEIDAACDGVRALELKVAALERAVDQLMGQGAA